MSLVGRIQDELDRLKMENRFRELPEIGERSGRFIHSGGRRLLNLSSNDYLGLGDDQCLLGKYLGAAGGELARYAMTSSSSRLLTGNHKFYGEIEEFLAAWYKRQSALVFNSGYHANIGILPALSSRHDLILCDRLNHASIIDGCRIAEAAFRRYRHRDYDHLEFLLGEAQAGYRQVFIVTESVFSMDGGCADLERLCEIRDRYGAFLIVDEAHGAGAFAETGQGLCEASGCTDSIDIIVGTFGKAFASIGAYGIMSALLRDYLVNTMRPFIFTTALPPAVLGWSRLVLEKQMAMGPERSFLQSLAERLRRALKAEGFSVPGESHIVPVVMGSNDNALRAAAHLQEEGFLVLPVRPPTVPENTARIRISLRADLSWDDISRIPEILKSVNGDP